MVDLAMEGVTIVQDGLKKIEVIALLMKKETEKAYRVEETVSATVILRTLQFGSMVIVYPIITQKGLIRVLLV